MVKLARSLDSSFLERAEYDLRRKRLIIYFTHGTSYIYDRVPREVWEDFAKAESKGAFYNKNIRGHYAKKKSFWEVLKEKIKLVG